MANEIPEGIPWVTEFLCPGSHASADNPSVAAPVKRMNLLQQKYIWLVTMDLLIVHSAPVWVRLRLTRCATKWDDLRESPAAAAQKLPPLSM